MENLSASASVLFTSNEAFAEAKNLLKVVSVILIIQFFSLLVIDRCLPADELPRVRAAHVRALRAGVRRLGNRAAQHQAAGLRGAAAGPTQVLFIHSILD